MESQCAEVLAFAGFRPTAVEQAIGLNLHGSNPDCMQDDVLVVDGSDAREPMGDKWLVSFKTC